MDGEKALIDHDNGTLKVGDRPEEKIERWVVWFVSMLGTHPTIEEARTACEKTGQPNFMIRPVPVALGSTTFEVVN